MPRHAPPTVRFGAVAAVVLAALVAATLTLTHSSRPGPARGRVLSKALATGPLRTPLVTVHGRSCDVVGHPAHAALVRQLARDVDAAVPAVTAVWGTGWARHVAVVVPDDAAELARLVPGAGDRGYAALATTLPGSGDTVLVDPATYGRLDATGRRVTLAHEVTHVASRDATGPHTPTWLVEGLADYVGFTGVDLPVARVAQELRGDVRAGRVPRALPSDAQFAAGAGLPQLYEQSWLAVRLLAARSGRPALLRLYRAVGGGTPLATALRTQLHLTLLQFTGAWVADLRSLA